ISELPAQSDNDAEANSKDRNAENHSITPQGGGSSKHQSQSAGDTSPGHAQGSEDKSINDQDVQIHSVGLKNGLPPLQSDSFVRLKSDTGVVLDRDFYNIPEGGLPDRHSSVGFNYLDIPEGGEHTPEFEHAVQWGLPSEKKVVQQQSGSEALCEKVVCENNGTCAV
ncbi:unnamed protein product, partial [Candidula unifasciata]